MSKPRVRPLQTRSPRLLSEAEAWREIAERVATRGLYGHGLCWEVDAELAGPNSKPCKARIKRHLWGHLSIDGLEPAGPHRYCGQEQERADIRVLAALFLALEAEDEASGHPHRKATP